MTALRLGTRGSLLARTQSGSVAAALAAASGQPVELVRIRAEGDDTAIPLDAPVRPGAFVATLRDALLAGEVDLVVHSFKDLPSEPLPGLVIAAVPARGDPRDALCSRDGLGLAGLPAGGRVGTSSPRRAAGLRRIRPDLEVVPIRGNIDTRLRKVAEGTVDAAVLALAGLARLDRRHEMTEAIDPRVLVPAPAQGALAVECRADELTGLLGVLDDRSSRLAVTAERAVLAGVQARCTTAVGALASWRAGRLELIAQLSGHAGIEFASASGTAAVAVVPDALALGRLVAERLLAGADDSL